MAFKVKPLLRRVFSLVAIVYIALNIVLYTFQRDLLYFPTPEINHSYTTLTLNHQGETLKIIRLNEIKEQALIYFGGNSETVVNGASEHLNDFPNHTLYLVNYRGYGGSSGKPSEQNLYADALFLYDALQAKHKSISIMGRSLGTGVATYVAVKRIIDKLILITPYDSIEAIAKSQYPIFPIGLLISDIFDSVSRAPKINAKTLIVVAGKDALIPQENTLRLVHAFKPERLKVKVYKDAGHSDVSHLAEYHLTLKRFMSAVIK